MRGALEDLLGVTETEISPNDRNVVVRFDPARTSVSTLLARLADAGKPARQK